MDVRLCWDNAFRITDYKVQITDYRLLIALMETITINNDKQSLNNVKVGKDVKIFNFVNAYGCSIDDGSKVGAFVEIQRGSTIGKN